MTTPPEPRAELDLGSAFGLGVTPQVTPNPRTIRFATSSRPMAESQTYRHDDAPVDDPRVASLFAVSPHAVDVLVGPDFVAVSLDRSSRWPHLLQPMLEAVAEAFGGEADDEVVTSRPGGGPAAGTPAAQARTRGTSRLERAWHELGHLHANRPEDFDAVATAARDEEPARRQVAASLLREAAAEQATSLWLDLVVDPRRSVRRAAIDAVVDVARDDLRPLLHRALADDDPWIRWKALSGIRLLGIEPSRTLVEALVADPDFRIRLEASSALHRP